VWGPLLVAVVVAFLLRHRRGLAARLRPVAGNSFVMGVLAVLFLSTAVRADGKPGGQA
jgi:hypothetical protein